METQKSVAVTEPASAPQPADGESTVVAVLFALSLSHLLNDVMQSLIPAVYPLLKSKYDLTFTQIGLITFTFQITASLLQPLVGMSTDRRPRPYSLATGMVFTLIGLVVLGFAATFPLILIGSALVGIGSSVFHPEASRVARLASGGKHGFAQSLFQVGGNAGSAIGPLLAAGVVVPRGQRSIALFSIVALVAMAVLYFVGRWYQNHLSALRKQPRTPDAGRTTLGRSGVAFAIGILILLVFSKYFYLVSISSYYTFYLIDRFGVSVESAQYLLFVFLGAVAVGTVAGGPVGDRIGFKAVIWGSILGVLPFTLALPHANLFWTGVLTVPIGLILASAFSAMMVYAQDLVPRRVGLIAGLFFGLAFGMAGIGAAVLGWLADRKSITFVYQVCAFLPAIGLLAGLLPNLQHARGPKRA